MTTVFENLSDGFYTAFFETDPTKRRDAIDSWIKTAAPLIQVEVENELRSYINNVLEKTWTEEGWRSRAKKFSGSVSGDLNNFLIGYLPFIEEHLIGLRLSIEHPTGGGYTFDTPKIIHRTSAEAHSVALRRAKETYVSLLNVDERKRVEAMEAEIALNTIGAQNDQEDDSDDASSGDRSANDDRSDSMNPNNDAYQDSMDNRSDQMNPNNDAYWSSRGH